MMGILNSEEILSISRVAIRISHAFAVRAEHIPESFSVTEIQIRDLASALNQLADTLHNEAADRMIQEAGEALQQGIEVMLGSCKRAINDLDTLVDRNQVIRKHRTVGGFAIERSWSDSVVTGHDSMRWTVDGGDLHSLVDLLQIYTHSVNLLVEALHR